MPYKLDGKAGRTDSLWLQRGAHGARVPLPALLQPSCAAFAKSLHLFVPLLLICERRSCFFFLILYQLCVYRQEGFFFSGQGNFYLLLPLPKTIRIWSVRTFN